MRAPIFRGKVVSGRIVLDNREGFKRHLASFEGRKVDLILRERTAQSSRAAQGYYFKVVVAEISDHTGHTPEEVHETLKKQFHIVSTTKLTSAEFREYITKILRFAAQDLGLVIPEPEGVEF